MSHEKRNGKSPVIPQAKYAEIYAVDGRRKYLDTARLQRLTEACRVWQCAARGPAQKWARLRVWLAFLLMRYGALRLGELLALNAEHDIFEREACVLVGGKSPRQVLLPAELGRELAELQNAPSLLRSTFFQLDSGYLRRKLYALAEGCALPKELASPNVLRHSRAIELLQNGMPMKVVQKFIGQPNLNLTAGFFDVPETLASKVVGEYLRREQTVTTSARNVFRGRVSRLKGDGLLTEVELTTAAGLKVVGVITEESAAALGLCLGQEAVATVKAPWVHVAGVNVQPLGSARNNFCGIVSAVKKGVVACEVLVDLPDGSTACSLMENACLQELELEPGCRARVFFKAFAVVINSSSVDTI